jgi:hypothetical protein
VKTSANCGQGSQVSISTTEKKGHGFHAMD